MRKTLMFLVFIFFTIIGYGQFISTVDCGDPKSKKTETEWITIDTINFDQYGCKDWIYSKITNITKPHLTLEYSPCKRHNTIEI